MLSKLFHTQCTIGATTGKKLVGSTALNHAQAPFRAMSGCGAPQCCSDPAGSKVAVSSKSDPMRAAKSISTTRSTPVSPAQPAATAAQSPASPGAAAKLSFISSLLDSRQAGYSMPGAFYLDPLVHEYDLKLMWGRAWLFAGYTLQLAKPGDYFTYEIGDDSIILIRNSEATSTDSGIRAFHNTCRHRGSRIVAATQETKHTKRLVCPYHQWSYERDGSLAHARDMDGAFEKSAHGLHEVHCEEVAGLLFTCLTPKHQQPMWPFAPARALMASQLEPHELATNAKIAYTSNYTIHANWKLVYENNRECLHCLAAGTPVPVAGGLSKKIEDVQPGDVTLGLHKGTGLVQRAVTAVTDAGERQCHELLFQDGRKIKCTPDHRFRCVDGSWKRADQLVAAADGNGVGTEVLVGFEHPLAGEDMPADYAYQAGPLALNSATAPTFARLLGYLYSDGCITGEGAAVTLCHKLDAEAFAADLASVTGGPVPSVGNDRSKFRVHCPRVFVQAALAVGAIPGSRIGSLTPLPSFLVDNACPESLVQEFLGGLFGGDGRTVSLSHGGTATSNTRFTEIGFVMSKDGRTVPASALEAHGIDVDDSTGDDQVPLPVAQKLLLEHQLLPMLRRVGVTDNIVVDDGRASPTSVNKAGRDKLRAGKGVGLQLMDAKGAYVPGKSYKLLLRIAAGAGTLEFHEHVGFRYCCHKQMRLTAAAAYYRMTQRVTDQRADIAARVERYMKPRSGSKKTKAMTLAKALAKAKVKLAQCETLHPAVVEWQPKQLSKLRSGLTASHIGGKVQDRFVLNLSEALEKFDIKKFFSDPREGVMYDHKLTVPYLQRAAEERNADGLCCNAQCENDVTQDEMGAKHCGEAKCLADWKAQLEAAAKYSAIVQPSDSESDGVAECDGMETSDDDRARIKRPSLRMAHNKVRYGVNAAADVLPLFRVMLIARGAAETCQVYDLSVPAPHDAPVAEYADENMDSFVAAGLVVHNCSANHPEYCKSNYDLHLTYNPTADGHFERDLDPHYPGKDRVLSYINARSKEWESLGFKCSPDSSFPGDGWYRASRMPLREGWVSESMDGKPVSRLMGRLPQRDMGSFRIHTLPNYWLHLSGDYGASTRLTPTGPHTTEARVDWLVHKDAVEGVDYTLDRVLPLWSTTSDQDWHLCEVNMQGVRSSAYSPGRLSQRKEAGLDRFINWYIQTMKTGVEQEKMKAGRL